MKNKNSYETARSNLLVAIVFTLINMLLVLFETDTMFLFSALIPYYFTLIAYYSEVYIIYLIPIVILLLYLGCWYFSKKHVAGLIVACILFVLDTIFMLWIYEFQFDISMLIDVIFHVWILAYLVGGILYHKKRKENPEITIDFEKQEFDENLENSKYLRYAEDTKAKIFLEEEILGRQVIYRRVKTVNELVINGKVYDEYIVLLEQPHALKARIDGHTIEAGCNIKSQMYLAVDGEIIKKKLRLI